VAEGEQSRPRRPGEERRAAEIRRSEPGHGAEGIGGPPVGTPVIVGSTPFPPATGSPPAARSPSATGSPSAPASASGRRAMPHDVAKDREAARERRLRRVALVLGAVLVVLVWRWAAGRPLRLAAPHLPAAILPYLPAAILVLLLGGLLAAPLLGAGRSPHVHVDPADTTVRLSDVVGLPVVVEEVRRSLEVFLDHRTFRQVMGGTPRRALLFEGPPGTGKTFVAKAVAAEAGVPFLFVSSSAFQSMYYGQTNRKIRAFFRALRRAARAEGGAIGFIEEIDAIGATRAGLSGGGREGLAGVVNELLVQLQSFDEPPVSGRLGRACLRVVNRLLPAGARWRPRAVEPANILVIGATNRAADLDPALVRPGRFDKVIRFDPPSAQGRADILAHYLARKAHDEELDQAEARSALIRMTFGYTPAMLEHLLDEALVWALRRGRRELRVEDVMAARLTEELGLAQPVRYSEAERWRIAVHEAGHATMAWLSGEDRRVELLSIVKRRDALGVTAHSPKEERFLRTRSELLCDLRVALAGQAAEELCLGEPSSGASADLRAATTIAAEMVGAYGMAGSLVSFLAPAGGGDLVARVLASDEGRAQVDRLLEAARAETRRELSAHRRVLDALADAVSRLEELNEAEVARVAAAAARDDPVDAVIDLRTGASPGGGRSTP